MSATSVENFLRFPDPGFAIASGFIAIATLSVLHIRGVARNIQVSSFAAIGSFAREGRKQRASQAVGYFLAKGVKVAK